MSAPLRTVPPLDLAEIQIGNDVKRMVDDAIRELAKLDDRGGVFDRAGRLVHVVRVSEPPKYKNGVRVARAVGSPTIRTLSLATLYEQLSTCARWLKWRASDKCWVPTLPSMPAARAVFERGEWGGLRSLVGVTTAPTFRADGSILQAPGFDPETGLLLWPNCSYAKVPNEPDHDAAKDAYRDLCATVRAFPFANDQHRAAWVCSVLSILARPAIDGPVPMFIMDANTRGAGKTKLVDAAFRIALGFGAANTSLPETNEEIRKTISACVLAGDQAVLFDNIRRQLGGEAIEGAVTGVTWKARRLGSDDQMNAPMRIVFFATANNASITSDMARRSLHVRLESPLENPEDRTDTFDLVQWIDDKRHHLVAWALTILRAWHCAGRPVLSKTMGSFEAWSAVIPQAVHWASGVDPLGARASADCELDEERMQIAATLACVEHLSSAGPITAKAIIAALYGGRDHDSTTPDHHPSYAGAREALEAATWAKAGATPTAQRVGKYFDKIKGRVVSGKRLTRGPVVHNQATWTVRSTS